MGLIPRDFVSDYIYNCTALYCMLSLLAIHVVIGADSLYFECMKEFATIDWGGRRHFYYYFISCVIGA